MTPPQYCWSGPEEGDPFPAFPPCPVTDHLFHTPAGLATALSSSSQDHVEPGFQAPEELAGVGAGRGSGGGVLAVRGTQAHFQSAATTHLEYNPGLSFPNCGTGV